MRVVETRLEGLLILEPVVFGDQRGFFAETYHRRRFQELGIDRDWVQDNHSRSARDTLRGLHFQVRHSQTKLCRVVSGCVLDVVVDLRRDSPTFGQWEAVELSEENHRQLFVPRGFAHGFVVRSDRADFLYKCDDYYHREDEGGLAWDDPDLGIDWGVAEPILSAKDRANPRLRDIPPDGLPRG